MQDGGLTPRLRTRGGNRSEAEYCGTSEEITMFELGPPSHGAHGWVKIDGKLLVLVALD